MHSRSLAANLKTLGMRDIAERGTIRTSSNAPFGLDLSTAVFDRATRLAKSMFGSAYASIILVHNGEIWRSRYANVLPTEDPLTESVLTGGELFWVEDGRLDSRFAQNPLVTGPPFLRFTAAVAIRLQDGSTPGVLSVSSLEPHPFDAGKASRLKDLADFVADEWARAQGAAALASSLLERDQALERSERSEGRLQLALELTDVRVWELDYVRRDLINAGAEDTFFCQPHTYESLYKDIYTAVDPRDRPAVEAAWKDHVENGSAYRPEYRVNRPDGREIWAQSAVKLFTDSRGRPVRMVGAIQNITARKRAEAERHELLSQLHHSQRLEALGTLAGGVAHEINNALVPVIAFTKLLAKKMPAGSRDRHNLDTVISAAHRTADLVKQILAFGRKADHRHERVDLALVLREALKMMRAVVPMSISLVEEIAPTPPIAGDPNRLHQVIVNLVSNAAQALEGPHGRITVGLRPDADGDAIHLSVADTGCGMDAATTARVFEPFFTTKAVGKGTGLGLAVVHGIIKDHGGRIEVESAPGQGTRFDIVLPTRIAGTAAH
jgi:signal transduction histidine kinase